MHTSFGGRDPSGFGDMATFQKWPNFPFGAWTIVIDIRVEGLETASRERISGVTNRVCLTTATTRFPCSSLKNFVGLNLRSGSISWCIMILISSV